MKSDIIDIINFFEFAEKKFNIRISFHTIYYKEIQNKTKNLNQND